ncbi:hypothetical protein NC653_013347 [Populus alba x Populus x berolinensis]|uniref:Uncharacterized protein n=1 Tax=Populus alba x Populus x berolinensis TaxID=444605 RepID=A0AAD6W2H8_9ROSI|nr:hypothetical protein NC653_013347 [Populus alba x Populus x berolinensis]
MKPNKGIYQMHTRFITFIGELVSLGIKSWELKATVMEEAKNLKMLDVDEFICSLTAYKRKIKELKVKHCETKKKGLALKFMTNHKEMDIIVKKIMMT